MGFWDIVCSLGYVLTFGCCCFFGCRKQQAQSGILVEKDWLEGLVMEVIHLLCQDAFWAGICTLFHIPVHTGTMIIIHLLVLFLILRGGRSGLDHLHFSHPAKHLRGQETVAWHKEKMLVWLDLVGIIEILIIIFKYCLSVFSPGLSYTYTNSDAGLHLREAVMVVHGQKVEGMFFSHFHNAMVIEVLKPLLDTVEWYKGFIAADLLFQFLELLVFFVLMRKIAGGLKGRILVLVILPLYYLAYPLNSFYFSFTYWGIGVMLVLYLALLVRQGLEQGFCGGFKWRMMLGCFSVVVCYMLFAPAVFIALWFFVARDAWEERHLKKLINNTLEIFLLPLLLGMYYCYFDFFAKQGTTIGGSIGNAGGIYSNLLANFALLLPFMIYPVLYQIRRKKILPECGLFLAFGGMAVLMWIGVRCGIISQYYYYKCYYPLWALGFAELIWSLKKLWENSREMVWSLCAVYSLCFILCVGGYERSFVSSMDEIDQIEEHRTELFDIYQWHQIYRSWGREAVPQGKLYLYQWIISYRREQKNDREVPLLTETEDYKDCYFYEGVVGVDLGMYYGWRYPLEEILSRIKENGAEYVVLLKKSDFMKKNPEFIKDREVVFETDCGYILKI
ncbi:MAG: hypothetical protein NC307_02945 [Roseburia sp.]|nr:hypothetical protein [Roseburia sp.]